MPRMEGVGWVGKEFNQQGRINNGTAETQLRERQSEGTNPGVFHRSDIPPSSRLHRQPRCLSSSITQYRGVVLQRMHRSLALVASSLHRLRPVRPTGPECTRILQNPLAFPALGSTPPLRHLRARAPPNLSALFVSPRSGEASKAEQGCTRSTVGKRRRAPKVQHGYAGGHSMDAPEGAACAHYNVKIPNPSHAAAHSPLPCRGPRPLSCHTAGAPLPASPQRPGYQSQSGHTAAPHHCHLPWTDGKGGAERRSMEAP